jgi:hypothetical protein
VPKPSRHELFCAARYTLTGGELKGLMVTTVADQLGITFEDAEALAAELDLKLLSVASSASARNVREGDDAEHDNCYHHRQVRGPEQPVDHLRLQLLADMH